MSTPLDIPGAGGYEVYFRRIPEYAVPDKPLGRHVRWDSRNVFYPFQPKRDPNTLTDQLWARRIGILNQLQVGSCTGNAQTGVLGTEPFFDTLGRNVQSVLNEAFALKVYSDAETIDGDGPYPPNDNGSSGQSAAQATLNDDDINGYVHVQSAQDMAEALQEGPLIIGVDWYDSFDSPNSSGLISISPGASVRGGHEIEIRGCKIAEKLFLGDNSWGTSWGVAGSFELDWSDMDNLFSTQGDCTKSIPLTQPQPTPVPPTASPSELLWLGGPGQRLVGGLKDWCAEARTRPDLVDLKYDVEAWAKKLGL